MISTVHTPLPILADTRPKVCAHFCAPSPESETTSTVCSATVVMRLSWGDGADLAFFFVAGAAADELAITLSLERMSVWGPRGAGRSRLVTERQTTASAESDQLLLHPSRPSMR